MNSTLESVESKILTSKDIQINDQSLKSYKSNHLAVDGGTFSQLSQHIEPLSPFKQKMMFKPILMVDSGNVEPEIKISRPGTAFLGENLQIDKHDSESFTSDDSSEK